MGELLFNLTLWLRTTPLVELALGLSETSLSLWIVTHFWTTAILQVIHILAISTAFGAILMINLRLFGAAGMDRTMAEIQHRYVRWIWGSLVVLVISGGGLILSDSVRNLINAVFWIKMILVVGAILASLGFHGRNMRRLAAGGTIGAGTKTAAIFVIVLWCTIMLCGRWIAYAPT
jgi:hypothetical protein